MSDDPSPHPFDAAIALQAGGDGLFRGCTHAAYGNMVGPYGGTTAAQMLNAVLRHPQRLGLPLALTVNYAGPVAEGQFDIQARPARTNRNTQHWLLEMRQGDEICTTASAVFGTRRPTWGATEVRMPQVPPACALPRSPGFVAWMNQYDRRAIEGASPDLKLEQEQSGSRSSLWVRDEPPRPLDYAALVALADVFFPRIFLRRGRWTPAGSVSITTYLHADEAELGAQSSRHVLAIADAQRYAGGWFDQSAQVWGDAGVLLASSHQLVYFKG